MPASAVIPAPIVYTNIAAVKKLVVTAETQCDVPPVARTGSCRGRPSKAGGFLGEILGSACPNGLSLLPGLCGAVTG